jgi:tRNA A37 N6-isopentenylltransferase MiaA
MRAIGYGHITSVLNGVMSLDDAKQRILVETRRYAKRQRTWLRKEPKRVELEGYKEVTAAITESQRLLELQMRLGGTYG